MRIEYDPDWYYGTPWYADDHKEELEEYYEKDFIDITEEEIEDYVRKFV